MIRSQSYEAVCTVRCRVGVLLALFATVSAHEGREVGDGKYEIVFGWRVEPAYTNLLNGPELEITTHGTDEQPVEGLDEPFNSKSAMVVRAKYLNCARYITHRAITRLI